LLIWRIGGDLLFASIGHVLFASIGHVREALQASLDARPEVKRVLLDFGPVDFIDVTTSDELLSLIKELKTKASRSLSHERVTSFETIRGLPG
jgi:anti-anti-sigma regulatory factor